MDLAMYKNYNNIGKFFRISIKEYGEDFNAMDKVDQFRLNSDLFELIGDKLSDNEFVQSLPGNIQESIDRSPSFYRPINVCFKILSDCLIDYR